MTDLLAHRGPDDSGITRVSDQPVGFGHRRLSIIDLSANGRQPMWDVSETALITYNGEIYNYRELRQTLEGRGYAFASTSDTEVLVNLYLEYGESMLSPAKWNLRLCDLGLADKTGFLGPRWRRGQTTVLQPDKKRLSVCQ